MTLPAFLLGAVLATLLGAGFHLWRGGTLGRLLLYLGLAWGGFWGGHLMAAEANFELFQIGPLYAGLGVLGALGALFLGYWLFVVQPSY